MNNQSGRAVFILITLIFFVGVAYLFFEPFLNSNTLNTSTVEQDTQEREEDELGLVSYTSEEMKLSFKYPKEWLVNEKNYDIMITSFPTKFGDNMQPLANEIKLFMSSPNGCHETIDENLKDPACGEMGEVRNEIANKEIENLGDMKFYKYLVRYSNGKEHRFYFLEKGERVIQIDKSPEPSIYDEEFDQIVRSIKFL